jgi:hypothetical protein
MDYPGEPIWKSWKKVVFRFFFLFLGFFLLNYEFVFFLITINQFNKAYSVYEFLEKPVSWLDKHIFHTGFNPVPQDMPGDNHYGVVYYLTAFLLFFIVTIVWTISDKQRPNYTKLYFWFRVYIRYMVALIMLSYGIDKLIPIQMSYPDVTDLLSRLGDQDHFSLLWNFVGVSPGYEIFTGICEITASLLLIFRRTHIFGALAMCIVLCNVVALNIFYNISVKFYSSLLLVCVLLLFIPYAGRMFQFFFHNRNVTLADKEFVIKTPWKKCVLIGLAIIMVTGTIILNLISDVNAYRRVLTRRQKQKLYDVAWFKSKDTLPPLLSDTLRWKRFALFHKNSAAVYSMKDSASIYIYDADTLKHIYTLHDNPDSTKWDKLYYAFPQKNRMTLTGKWKGIEVQMMMDEIAIDSMTLIKDKIKFLQD